MTDEFFYSEQISFSILSREDHLRTIENLLASIDIDIFVVNRYQIIIFWNDSIARHFLPREQAIGKHLSHVFPGFFQEYRQQIWGTRIARDVIEQGRQIDQPRYPLRTQEGMFGVFDLQAYPLIVGESIQGAVGVLSNVTEKIKLEDQLVRAARTTSLANLGASIAHEIRNPLNSISLNVQLIHESLTGKRNTDMSELASTSNMIVSEIKRLDDIIRNFLQFSRPPQAKLIHQNPSSVIEFTLKLLGEEARRGQVDILTELDPKLPDIPMDRHQISQAIYNVALNSLQAMPNGGTLTVSASMLRETLLIRITDDGPGIPEESKSRLFDLFYSTKEEGTGLGLPIANQIIENHGGSMVAENHPEGGACISIYLPSRTP
ncbi:MAG: ATP-binding protein [Planctomycetota bacterium]|jgi:signal transduction histidine kinase|nr:ATP-binding protein [Planctomycetota bacterium]